MTVFFTAMAFLTLSGNRVSIYFNEKLWLLKLFLFFGFFAVAMSFSLFFIFSFAIISKYISILAVLIQLNVAYDSLLIFMAKIVLPALNQSTCGIALKLIFGYALPVAVFLFLLAWNSLYGYVCTTYLTVIIVTTLCCLLLLAINIIRGSGPSTISSLWFICFIELECVSVINSTSHSTCVDTSGKALASWQWVLYDCVLHICLLGFCLSYICFTTKSDLENDEYIIEPFVYKYVLSEEGRDYILRRDKNKVLTTKKLSKMTPRDVELVDFKQLRALKVAQTRPKSYLGIDINLDKLGKSLSGPDYRNAASLPHTENGTNILKSYRSHQAFWFHAVMALFSCYAGVMFIGWIHIDVNQNIISELPKIDDVSIWVRFIALTLSLLSIIFKSVKTDYRNMHYRYNERHYGY